MTPITTPRAAAQPPDEARTVGHVVGTGAVFAAVLERLNRDAALALIEELGQELDAHCRTFIAAQVTQEFAARERTWRRRWLALSVAVLLLAGVLFVLAVSPPPP